MYVCIYIFKFRSKIKLNIIAQSRKGLVLGGSCPRSRLGCDEFFIHQESFLPSSKILLHIFYVRPSRTSYFVYSAVNTSDSVCIRSK